MPTQPLGRWTTVPVREIWAHEANDFTPWLAEPENIALLAETLRLGDLEVEATERTVGDFSADIVARNQGGLVLIENQLESTDHRHLGQLLTYLAGLEEDATIVWVSTSFREEHRAAIDWLNANTNDRFDFFGVEIEVGRVGTSQAAPRFHIIAKPNDWSRGVRSTARSVTEAPQNDRQRAYMAYWSAFREYLAGANSDLKVRSEFSSYWCRFRIGKTGIVFDATAKFRDKIIGVELYIQRSDGKRAFEQLQAQRQEIEQEFDEGLVWEEVEGRQARRIGVYRSDLDPEDPSTRLQQFEWMRSKLERLMAVLRPRVMDLQLSAEGESSEPNGGST